MNIIRRILASVLTLTLICGLCGCAATAPTVKEVQDQAQKTGEEIATYTIGVYNYFGDKSLDVVVENFRKQLEDIGEKNNVNFEVVYEYCDADPEVLDQVVAKYISDEVDLVVGVATPVAESFRILAEGINTPVIFAALSDPEGAGLVEEGAADANIIGVLDYIDLNAVLDLINNNTPFVLKGSIEDYQTDFANLGIEAANMAKSILIDGNNPANIPVVSITDGNISISPELADLIGIDSKELEAALEPLVEKISSYY